MLAKIGLKIFFHMESFFLLTIKRKNVFLDKLF